MNRLAIAALVATAGTVASPASAQSFNVDLSVSAGAAASPIGSGFAACGRPGFWNTYFVNSRPDMKLVDVDGVTTGVNMTFPASASAIVPAGNADTGDFRSMMADGFPVSPITNSDNYSFHNMAQGRYLVYVYFANTGSGIDAAVDVAGFGGQSIRLKGGSAPDTFKAGGNYTMSLADVGADGELSIWVARVNGGQATVAGIQVVDLAGGRKPLFVTQTGSGDRSGTSWANAVDTVIEPLAMIAAAYEYETLTSDSAVDFDLWVAEGTYHVTDPAAPDRDDSLRVYDGTRIYGGFAGTESGAAQRVPGHETNITGQLGAGGGGDNSRQLLVLEQCSDQTLIDGVTLSDAFDERVSTSTFVSHGGAALILGSNTPSGEHGPVFRDVLFDTNIVASEGGAVYINLADTTFERCTFNKCKTLFANSDSKGGAVVDRNGGSAFINCTFLRCESVKGSAVYMSFGGSTFAGCRFIGNYGTYSTIHVLNGSTTEFDNTLIAGNINGLNGAALYAQGENADVALKNVTLAQNDAKGASAGILLRDGADASVFNSIIWGNTASIPTAGFEGEASIDVVNGPTDVAFAYSSVQHGTHMEIAFNTASFANNDADPMFVDTDGADNVPYNEDDDYRLLMGSPAQDSADTSFAPLDPFDLDGDGQIWEESPYDLDGNPRVVDLAGVGSNWLPNTIDRGAYETAAPFCTADLTTTNTNPGDADYGKPDGKADGADLSFYVEHWLAGDTNVADVNTTNTNPGDASHGAPDGKVDGADLSYFVESWLNGCS